MDRSLEACNQRREEMEKAEIREVLLDFLRSDEGREWIRRLYNEAFPGPAARGYTG